MPARQCACFLSGVVGRGRQTRGELGFERAGGPGMMNHIPRAGLGCWRVGCLEGVSVRFRMMWVGRGRMGWRMPILALLSCATVHQPEVLQLPGGGTLSATKGC
jgi:hypothetical protein